MEREVVAAVPRVETSKPEARGQAESRPFKQVGKNRTWELL
jgi:hypothetical protein